MRKLHLLGLALALTTSCTGDGSGDGDTSDGTDSNSSTTGGGTGGTGGGSDSDSGGGACPGIVEEATVAEGDPCTDNDECLSGVCLQFQDVPDPTDAVCGALPAGCETRVTATIKNFETGEALAGVDVDVAAALEAATNPTGITSLLSVTSDADGKIDAVTAEPLNAPIGVVALVGSGEFYLTATGLAEPASGNLYAPGVGIHELWAVPTSTLEAWSTALEGDGAVSGFLPLGEAGGVVGKVRDIATGDGVAGAQVVTAAPDTSVAVVRYLAEDGTTFVADQTSSNGLFVLFAPTIAEEFVVMKDGMEIQDQNGIAGSTSLAVFTLVMDVNLPG